MGGDEEEKDMGPMERNQNNRQSAKNETENRRETQALSSWRHCTAITIT